MAHETTLPKTSINFPPNWHFLLSAKIKEDNEEFIAHTVGGMPTGISLAEATETNTTVLVKPWIDLKCFQKISMINFILTDLTTGWLTTWCLQANVTQKWLMLWAQIFLLFDVASASAFWHTTVHTMHSLWTYQHLYFCSMYFCWQCVNLVVAHDGFLS